MAGPGDADWYKDPTTDEDPNNWAYTPVGKLVHGAESEPLRVVEPASFFPSHRSAAND